MKGLFRCLVFAAVLSIGSLTFAQSCLAEGAVLQRGLIAHWAFGEGSGEVISDSSGEGNDGKIIPHTPNPKWGSGDFAGSLSFDGRNEYFVRIPASASLNKLQKQISVVALIYPRTLWPRSETYVSIIKRKWKRAVQLATRVLGGTNDGHKIQGSTGFIAIVQRQWRKTIHPDQYYLGYGLKDNTLHYKWHLGLMDTEMSLYEIPKGQDKPTVGKWVQLVGTYNGNTGKLSLYVDGELIGSQTHVGEIRLDAESMDRPLAIGAELNGPSTDDPTGEFDGYIRDVRIYDRALSEEEVRMLAAAAKKQQ